MMLGDFERVAQVSQGGVDGRLNIKLDFSPEVLPVNKQVPAFEFYRDGKRIKTYKLATSSDPDFLRAAEKEGYFIMSPEEVRQQGTLMKQFLAYKSADGADAKELAKLRHKNTRRTIEELAPAGSETLTSILPKMHLQRKPRESTKRDHLRVAREFRSLHGDISLEKITKGHVRKYVEHVLSMTFKGQPLAPSTVKQRLEKLSAILQFAVSIDAMEYNVARDVKAPKDDRPLGDQTYKPFEKSEVRTLIDVGTEIWTKRRYATPKTRLSRKDDFITALHLLTWTGARPEEVCQLTVEDVHLDRMGIVITNLSDDLDSRQRQLKNEESVRGIPIHRILFPRLKDHVEHVTRVSNSGLLFPSFEPDLKSGRYARFISTEWTQHLRQHVTDDPQKVLYSLRHSWAGESKNVGMSEAMRNDIMGHASNSESSSAKRYTHLFDDLNNQLEWVNKMDCIND